MPNENFPPEARHSFGHCAHFLVIVSGMAKVTFVLLKFQIFLWDANPIISSSVHFHNALFKSLNRYSFYNLVTRALKTGITATLLFSIIQLFLDYYTSRLERCQI